MPHPDPHDVGRLWVEEGESRIGPVASVAPVSRIDAVYSYAVPPELEGRLRPGQRVRVRLGRRGTPVEGFCLELQEAAWERTLRPVDELVEDESYLSPELLELGRWIARYYCCPLGPTLAAMVPKAVRARRGFVTRRTVRLLKSLEELAADGARVSDRMRSLLTALADAQPPADLIELRDRTGVSDSTIRAAARKGWIVVEKQQTRPRPPGLAVPRLEPDFEPTAEQRAALAEISPRIESGGFSVSLLFGVSGSGKTEVYVRAMRKAVELGRQAILLVPEIALTTQLVGRLAERFEAVAVIHSGLGDAARSLYWQAIARGEISVVIGTRSAVFAPCPKLGLIVIDEEQETSYKNLRAPRFHVRDVAVKRAQSAAIPVLLGSATPSLETWWNCRRHEHYRKIELPRRVRGLALPKVTLVPTDPADLDEEPPALSVLLRERLVACLARGEQAVVLINRRGFAWGIRCPQCGWRLNCPHCNVPMVFHAVKAQALCHHCGGKVPVAEICPVLGCGARTRRAGAGTQRVEEELRALLPTARIARADSDNLKRSAQYQQLVDRFSARDLDVLVGTQMIAKGLDFPFVSLVGVVGADLVSSTDFRAAERLFQLVTQVAGRAGRADTGGEVIVQSLTAEAPTLKLAVAHDFPAFAEAELEIRRRIALPPLARLTRFLLTDPDDARAREAAKVLVNGVRADIAAAGLEHVDVLGPRPCALTRLRGRYRHEALLRAASAGAMQNALERLRTRGLLRPRVAGFVVDVDPVSLA